MRESILPSRFFSNVDSYLHHTTANLRSHHDDDGSPLSSVGRSFREEREGSRILVVRRKLPSHVEECDFSEAVLKRARTIKRTWRSTGVIHKTIRAVSNAVEGLDGSMNLNPCRSRLHL